MVALQKVEEYFIFWKCFWDSVKHVASEAMREEAVVFSVKAVIQQNQNCKLYFRINWIWCHILLLSWTLDSCKVKNTGEFSEARSLIMLLFHVCSGMFQSGIWIVLAFILTRLCYCICLTAFKQQKTCTTYLNNTREIKVMRMHCQQMKIKKSCCLKKKKKKNCCCKMLLKFYISNSESCWWFILI